MATKNDNKELWAGFARDAMSAYVIPDEVDDVKELINDMADVATGYADAMLEEFENRFEDGPKRRRSRRKSDDDEDDDPDDD
jgi:hypothetical protein